MSLIVILVLPLLAVLVSWTRTTSRAGPVFTLLTSIATLAVTLHVWARLLAGGRVVAISGWIEADGLSVLILLMVSVVGLTASIFSLGYVQAVAHSRWKLRVYYANYNLFLFSMLAVPVLIQPNLVWTAVELTTLFSVLLVSFENTHEALEAAWKYVVLTLMGAAIALFGFLILSWAYRSIGGRTYTWAGLAAAATTMNPLLLKVAFLMILVGFGVKAGLVPLHTWLPDAHSQAPSPVCALLSGVETTVVIYSILRLVPIMKAAPVLDAANGALALGLLSTGVASFLLLQVHDYKRLFAFSTVEHMGIVLTAVGLNSQDAYYGAMYQVLSHALTKSFCFYAAGAALLVTGTRKISSVRGLIRRSPVAGTALLAAALAIAGAPPFAVFLSELFIFKAGLDARRYIVTGMLALFVAIAFCGILLHINRMVFGRPIEEAHLEGALKDNEELKTGCLPASCIVALALGGALILFLGMYLPAPVHTLLRMAALGQ
jgi:hydrogenase-4 component F